MSSNSKLYLFLTIFYLGILGCASEQLTSARLYIQQENWEKAEELLDSAKAGPDSLNPEVYYLLGELIYSKHEEWRKMDEMFNKAMALDSNRIIDINNRTGKVSDFVLQTRSRFWTKQFNNGLKHQQNFEAQIRSDKPLEIINLGDTKNVVSELMGMPAEQNEIVSFGSKFTQWVYWPDNLFVYFSDGIVASYMRIDSEKNIQDSLFLAIKDIENSVLIDPKDYRAYSVLSKLYDSYAISSKAIQFAKKGVELGTKEYAANFTAGQIFLRLENPDEALKYLLKAVEIDSTSGSAIRSLATAYYDLDDKEKSIETYLVAIKNETDRTIKADLHFNLGVLYMQLGNDPSETMKDTLFLYAEDNFGMAFDLNPDDTSAVLGIAQTFLSAEKWSRAEKYYRELIYLEPNEPEYYRGLYISLIRQDSPEKELEAKYYLDKSKQVGSK